jgi:hypothetical protein
MQEGDSIDMAFVLEVASCEIHGTKWHDLDGDGEWDDGEPGLPDWMIYLDQNNNGLLDQGTVTVDTGGRLPIPLPDNDTFADELSISGAGGV